ncbi:MAG: hypothetical protein FIA99_11515 [Ruminiclostridium sp.]|nr:hypothetical protein [Ruminiclostridium sp.]
MGVLQPIIYRVDKGNKYIIVAGECRYRASLSAGLKEIYFPEATSWWRDVG